MTIYYYIIDIVMRIIIMILMGIKWLGVDRFVLHSFFAAAGWMNEWMKKEREDDRKRIEKREEGLEHECEHNIIEEHVQEKKWKWEGKEKKRMKEKKRQNKWDAPKEKICEVRNRYFHFYDL